MHGSLKVKMQPEWAYTVIIANNISKDRKLKPKYPFMTKYP